MHTFLGVFKWWLSLLLTAVVLTGCGGGSGTTSTSISGTAATGAALTGTIELVDANGVTRNVTIEADGAYTVDTTGLAAPFILRATGSGNDAGIVLYSFADGVSGIFNITPLTQLAVELLRQGIGAGAPADLGALFAAWNAQVNPADLATLQASMLQAQARINANLHQQFTDAGLTPANFDFLRTAFLPNRAGIDAVLDLISGLTIAGNTITMNVNNSAFSFNVNIDITDFNIGGGNAGGGGGGGDFAALPAGLSSKVFDLTYQHAQAGSPFSNGTVQKFTFSGSHMLFLGEAPERNLGFATKVGSEYIWFDATNNVAYAASLKLDGSLNEINVAGSTNGTPWYGQFAGAAASGGAGAAGSLTLGITVSGVPAANVVINGVTKPTTQAEFCADMTSNSSTSLSNALGAVGTFTINSCTFNGSVGNVSATLALAGVGSIPYTVVYTFN